MIPRIVSFLPSVVIPIVVNFVLIMLYARLLTPAAYGEYSIYVNSIAIMYGLTAGFVQAAAFRFYSMDGAYASTSQYVTTFLLSNLGMAVLLSGAFFGLSFLVEIDWLVVCFAVTANSLYQFYLNWYRLRDSTAGFTFGRLSASFGALAAILVWMAVYDSASFVVPIYTFYGAYVVLIIVGLISTLRHVSVKAFSWDLLVRAFKYGMPMSGVTVVALLVPYGAQFAILFHLSQSDVGAYSLAFRLSDATLANVTMIILTVMTPAVMRAYDKSGEDGAVSSTGLLTKMISLNFWATIPICFAFVIVAGPLITLLFPAYHGAEAVLIWIVFAAALRSLSMITFKRLELAGATRLLFVLALVSAAINIGYVAALIPVYGLAAAGHASFVSYLILNVLLIFASRSRARIAIDFAYLVKVLGVSLAATLVAFMWAQLCPVDDVVGLLVNLGVFGVVYLSLSFVLRLHRGFRVL